MFVQMQIKRPFRFHAVGTVWLWAIIAVVALVPVGLASARPRQHTALPATSTREEVQQYLARIENERALVQRLIDEAGNRIYTSGYDGTKAFVEATIGPLFGTSQEFNRLLQTLEEAELATQSGHGAIAAQKWIDAIKQMKEFIQRASAVLAGDTEPKHLKELARRFWLSRKDWASARDAGIDVERAREEADILIHYKHTLNLLREQLVQQLLTSKPSAKASGGRERVSVVIASPDATLIDVLNCTEPGTQAIYARNGRNCDQLMKQLDSVPPNCEPWVNAVEVDRKVAAHDEQALRVAAAENPRSAEGVANWRASYAESRKQLAQSEATLKKCLASQ